MRFQHSIAVGIGLLTLLLARQASAQAVTCDTTGLGATPILYVENGDTQEPLLKRFGKALLHSANPVRIVYRNRPTCDLAGNFNGARTLAPVTGTARPVAYIPDDPAFDITMASPQCDLPATAPTIELAIGATFLSSCTAAQLGTQQADTTVLSGPNQAYGFVVHPMSSQVAITAAEGYLAYGFVDDTGGATPWITQALRLTRGATASTTLTSAANIGLLPSQMLVGSQLAPDGGAPVGAGNSGLIVTAVSTETANPQAVIGALGGDLYDANRAKLKMLAFKAFNQFFGYFPDSTSSSFDKINVRDGHYLVWSPTQYIFAHGADPNTPADANAARVVSLLFGATTEADVNGLDAVAKSGLIPQCAMKVTRSRDGGDLSLFSPPDICGCFFESAVPSGSTACNTCTDDTTCGGGKCRHGYCEAK